MTRDSRDLDGVIDDVAQAMTGAELSRDLRPAIAARLASGPSWTLGWRVATAAAGLAVAVVVVVVVSRPVGEPQQPPAMAEVVTQPPTMSGGEPGPARTVARVAASEPRPARPIAHVARQTIVPATLGIVEIDSVAIVPLKEDDVASGAPASSQVVVIPLKDVPPVRISQLGSGE